jgi:hypothetical protein
VGFVASLDDAAFKDVMGALAVVIAVAAYAIYAWQSVRGAARPHPLSWLIFGILTGTAYLVQLDQAAGPGSWVVGITAVVCLALCVMGFWRGERTFPWYEWAFLVAATIIFVFYLLSRSPELVTNVLSGAAQNVLLRDGPAISAILATVVSVLGFGPTVTKAWVRPQSDSAATFLMNGLKFVPALFGMDRISLAIFVYPVVMLVANVAVAALIYLRRLQVGARRSAE